MFSKLDILHQNKAAAFQLHSSLRCAILQAVGTWLRLHRNFHWAPGWYMPCTIKDHSKLLHGCSWVHSPCPKVGQMRLLCLMLTVSQPRRVWEYLEIKLKTSSDIENFSASINELKIIIKSGPLA